MSCVSDWGHTPLSPVFLTVSGVWRLDNRKIMAAAYPTLLCVGETAVFAAQEDGLERACPEEREVPPTIMSH